MTKIKTRSKNSVDLRKKPRVWFTCHPDDLSLYLKKICDDIFDSHDCAVYYTENMVDPIPPDEQQTSLGHCNLLVIPVTLKLLTMPNRAMDEDFPYAKQENIPILPILVEPVIDSKYTQKFGELQYLNSRSTDSTEIPYSKKLKKYLESVLISDELADRIRAAFDAYIFLSYRKKDRKYANELMHLIHSYPNCQNIAVWFDEYLTPGESFRENIKNILDNCKLFTLLVTPRLLEKVVDENGQLHDNYVIAQELPLAQKKKEKNEIDIVAVEMEETEKTLLSAMGIRDFTKTDDNTFRERLLDSLSKVAITENSTPEHDFLIGLAYFEGIDLEVDRSRGLKLITSAAEAGILEAMKTLVRIYSCLNDEGIKWAEQVTAHNTQTLGEEHPETIDSMLQLSRLYYYYQPYDKYSEKLCELYTKIYALQSKLLGPDHPDTQSTKREHVNFLVYRKQNSRIGLRQLEQLYEEVCGRSSSDDKTILINLAISHHELGEDQTALDLMDKAYDLAFSGRKNSLYNCRDMASFASNYFACGASEKAVQLYESAYALACQLTDETHPEVMGILIRSASFCDMKKHPKASVLYKRALLLYKKIYEQKNAVLGEYHEESLLALRMILAIYKKLGDPQESRAAHEKAYNLLSVVDDQQIQSIPASLIDELFFYYKNHKIYYKEFQITKLRYRIYSKYWGERHWHTLSVLHDLAHSYGWVARDNRKASELFQKAYTLRCSVLGPENAQTLSSLSGWAFYCAEPEKQLELYQKLYNLRCKTLEPESPDTLRTLEDLAFTYREQQHLEKALSHYEKLYTLLLKNHGPTDPRTHTTKIEIARIKKALAPKV